MPKYDRVTLASDLLPPVDFLCFILAGFIATLVYSLFAAAPPSDISVAIDRSNVVLVGAILAPFVLYDRNFAVSVGRQRTIALTVMFGLRFVLITTIVIAIGTGSLLLKNLPLSWVALWLGASATLTASVRMVVAKKINLLHRTGAFTESVAIVGAGPVADQLSHQLRNTKGDHIDVLGHFTDFPYGVTDGSTRPMGTIAELVELGRRRSIDWILVALPVAEEVRLDGILQKLEELSIPIALYAPGFGSRLSGEKVLHTVSGMQVLLLADRPIKRWNAVLKNVEDFLLSLILILILLPLLVLIVLAIKLDSPGPVIFRQSRHGINNSEFNIYKFRTMRFNGEASGDVLQQTARLDPRVTRVGRCLRSTSLDELPQLFNVLKGEMSLVGPRPHAVIMRTRDRLGSEISRRYAQRHRVKPGITGWAQVNGARGATSTTEQVRRRVALDLMYINGFSLWLDLKILVLTFRAVLGKTNAY